MFIQRNRLLSGDGFFLLGYVFIFITFVNVNVKDWLMSIAKNNSIDDFNDIFNYYYPRLVLFAIKILGNKEDSEGVVQEVFMRFWMKEIQYNIKYSVKGFLFRSVFNACLDLQKKNQRQRNQMMEYPFRDSTEFRDPILEEELDTAISKAISELPDQCRKIFNMSRQEEMTYKQIAEKLEISHKTVETQISRSLKHLRKRLVEYLPSLFL